MFLDEPDNYLALREIQPWLAVVAEHCGSTLEQAIVVSHHPVTIDYLAGAKGRWFYRDGNGPVRVSDQPERTVDGISLSETVARGWEKEPDDDGFDDDELPGRRVVMTATPFS